jgi:hypothetical protein
MKRVLQVIDTEFTLEQRNCFEVADRALATLQESLKTCATLTALETGEVIGIEELARVRGILDAFARTTYFQTQRNAFRTEN